MESDAVSQDNMKEMASLGVSPSYSDRMGIGKISNR